MRKWRPQRDYCVLTILWVNGETEADPDITGGKSWMRLYYEYKKKSVGNPRGILAVALRKLFHISKLILSYLSSRIITSFWNVRHKNWMNS